MGQLPEFPANNALQSLSLFYTNFSGKLPESIGNLKFLTNLELYDCNFFGPIPSSIANLSHLVNLYLGGNRLSDSIHSSLFTLPSLKTLYLGENQLVGKIDEFPNASSSLIQELDIGNNYLTGPIPKSILQLPRLEVLEIGENSFSSLKLDMFVQLKNLKDLDLSNVSLLIESDNRSLTFPQLESLSLRSCNLTEFPEFIKRQDKLVDLDLSNNHIHGVVPNWLWKSSLSSLHLSFNVIDFPKKLPLNDANFSFPMLRRLNLESCNISAFPEFLKSQENLEELDLSNNKISGAIPNWVWKKSLRYLYLANNHLSSLDQLLPNQSSTSSQTSSTRPICNLSQIKVFNAPHNNLSGTIPNCLGKMNDLYLLDLQGNNFSGMLPKFSKATQLSILKVSENRLEGKLPRSLVECTLLEVLDVGNNMMNDTFPFWLQKLPYLTVLILRENRFYGQIKHFKHKFVFPNLDVLDIASNQFSGELSINFLQATLTCLDLSSNSFHGRIPEEIKMLRSLKVLNLSYNSFSGEIPVAVQNLKDLESLDLSQNELSGKIPPQLTTLTFLEALNLSYNPLEGSIPQGNQFSTFSNDSYRGNPKLCGQPLSKKCNEDGLPVPPPPGEEEQSWLYALSTWKIVLIGYGSGLVAGLCIGYTVLNELGNKWVDKFKKHGKRNRRRSR
ncbi:hypothetical protein ES319_1Z088100v1 [Gossypium barbadense]|nr:hypothetical protein ES319_1Z088100v1 [Gossypium barbadense]